MDRKANGPSTSVAAGTTGAITLDRGIPSTPEHPQRDTFSTRTKVSSVRGYRNNSPALRIHRDRVPVDLRELQAPGNRNFRAASANTRLIPRTMKIVPTTVSLRRLLTLPMAILSSVVGHGDVLRIHLTTIETPVEVFNL